MDEAEARQIANLPKKGEPRDSWTQNRAHTYTNEFGVLDMDGKALKGLSVEFEVFISPGLKQTKFVFTLNRYHLGLTERAYQLEINSRKGLRPTDHAYSHEHYGNLTFKADSSWAYSSFQEAVKRFCANTSLTFTGDMPDPETFNLK